MLLTILSDTHCQLDKVHIPHSDILVHAGDLTYSGNIDEIAKELAKLKKLRHPFKIIIAGNHDRLGENNPTLMKQMCDDAGLTYLNHEAATIGGINFFGSPYTPRFGNWAYGVDRESLGAYWQAIPENTQILITHGPPQGILDKCPNGDLAGCADLYVRTQSLPVLTHHIFGHIHEGYGVTKVNNVTYINASICNGKYKPVNKSLMFNI